MNALIISYIIGLLVNLALAVMCWRELVAEKVLVKLRIVVVTVFVLLSFVTWIYIILYLILTTRVRIEVKKRKDGTDVH